MAEFYLQSITMHRNKSDNISRFDAFFKAKRNIFVTKHTRVILKIGADFHLMIYIYIKKKSQFNFFKGGNIQVYVTDALSDNRINLPPL